LTGLRPQDIPYLTPVLEEVQKEMAEREEWDAKNK
jgi:hypothetical protein